MRERINMISLMNLAWGSKSRETPQRFEDETVDLLMDAYYEATGLHKYKCALNGKKDYEDIYRVFNRIFIALMLIDGNFNQEEYNIYMKFCKRCEKNFLNPDECRSFYSKLSLNSFSLEIRKLLDLRNEMTPTNYENMVEGFCHLTQAQDHKISKYEFNILKCLFDENYDYVPYTFEQFENEY